MNRRLIKGNIEFLNNLGAFGIASLAYIVKNEVVFIIIKEIPIGDNPLIFTKLLFQQPYPGLSITINLLCK